MRLCLAVLLVTNVAGVASEKVSFFETWETRPALRDLWRPMCECWLDNELGMKSPRIAAHFKDYAKHHSPEALVPQIFADLKTHDTELTEIAYLYLLAQWPRDRVLRLLEPLRQSRDADKFYDDLLKWKGG
jgi:hypothetical protein